MRHAKNSEARFGGVHQGGRFRNVTRRGLILVAAAVAVALVAAPHPARPGAFIWNFSSSIAVGLYRIADAQWKKGDYVAVDPKRVSPVLMAANVLKPGRLLLKRVAAAGGDVVCRNGNVITINGELGAVARTSDGEGRSLPSWSGCTKLSASQIFLLGDNDHSFDGRYFGIVDSSSILGRLSRVMVWK